MLPSYVVLDLETTGGSATGDFVTEIAAVRIDHDAVTERWSSLVNPGVPISYFIQNLTGINDAMVEYAPRFKQVADKLLALLEGSVLVAHNAAFDHGFLRGEFARLNHDLRIPSLCTVRLSRKLYPQFKSHGLDAIMQRHHLQTDARHRAMGDVDMVLAWLAQAQAEFGIDRLREAAQALLQPPLGLPVHLETQVDDVPDSPGVYLFYGDAVAPLFIGSGVNLRQRVTAQLQTASKSTRDRGIAANTRRIETRICAGEVGALLLEKKLVAQLKPTYGRGKPPVHVDVRALHAWPHPGAIGLREHDIESGRSELLVFHHWRHVATVQDEGELDAVLANLPANPVSDPPDDDAGARIDLDIYRLLVKRLLSPTRMRTGLIFLPPMAQADTRDASGDGYGDS
jgi:DNA polymerase III epsilon subunit family exonuclease